MRWTRNGRIVLFAAGVAVLASSILIAPARAAAAPAAGRLAGGDPTETSVAVSRAGWTTSARVVVASAGAWTDALAAAGLGAPILYTYPQTLPGAVSAEIRRLGATEAVVVGGTAAVSDAVRGQIRSLGLHLVEAKGTDRYHTAAQLAELLPESGEVIVASGETFADAASIAPYAAARRVPVFLANGRGVPVVTPRLERATRTIVVGGYAAVPEAAVKPFANRERLAGPTRYETSVVVAGAGLAAGLNPANLVLASGEAPVDAIIAGALAGRRGSPVLLVPPGPLPADAQTFLARVAPHVRNLSVVGAQVGETVLAEVASSLEAGDVLAWVNGARQGAQLAALPPAAPEIDRALAHSRAMAAQARLFHQTPGCAWWGEAVGTGETAREVFEAWMRSGPHQAVVFMGEARTAGTAVVTAADGAKWVTLVVCG